MPANGPPFPGRISPYVRSLPESRVEIVDQFRGFSDNLKHLFRKVEKVAASLERSLVEGIVREFVVRRLGAAPATRTAPPATLRVNISARHAHISQPDLEHLFGTGYRLTPLRPLYQEGQFAAEETVTLLGPKRRLLSNVRILGPVRERTQVELAFTDAVMLGIENVPVRLSGDTAGTPGCVVLGPVGILELAGGVIRAARHVHMSPADADYYGVKHKDTMRLRVGGEAGLVLDRIHVRVDPSFKLEVHVDTDEGNACGLHLAPEVALIR
jgi:putative phosphotransacetylase